MSAASPWERPVHVVIMSPDGSVVEEVGGGLRIHGGSTRGAVKKSFRLYLPGLYGETSGSSPGWRTRRRPPSASSSSAPGGNDVFIGVRDQVHLHPRPDHAGLPRRQRPLCRGGFFAALHINGEYWGLYDVAERISDDLMEHTYGGPTGTSSRARGPSSPSSSPRRPTARSTPGRSSWRGLRAPTSPPRRLR